jgi:hypothetical protein
MAAVPGAIVGAGTVLNEWQLSEAQEAGARFIVAPGLTEPLTRAALASGIAYLPGVATAGDIMRGLDLGLTRFKFFPAEASGGLARDARARRPVRNRALLPDRRDHRSERAGLAGRACRHLHRRQLDGEEGHEPCCHRRGSQARRGDQSTLKIHAFGSASACLHASGRHGPVTARANGSAIGRCGQAPSSTLLISPFRTPASGLVTIFWTG